jgi:hypothetical protein
MKISLKNTISNIIEVTSRMEHFWRNSGGWAPVGAAMLLASARLDRQTSFAHTLEDYLSPFPPPQLESRQILGYVTLRSLCEGALKLFFAVYLSDYLRDPVRDGSGQVVPPERVKFDRLIGFYSAKVDSSHDAFLRRVQSRGNAIHHFSDRPIGLQQELIEDIVSFWEFLTDVDGRLPYPEG